MKVIKFGGSSVGTPQNIKKTLDIAKSYQKENGQILVVVSAFKGVTDQLIALARLSISDWDECMHLFEKIKKRHIEAIRDFIIEENQEESSRKIEDLFNELKSNIEFIKNKDVLNNQGVDNIISFGERLSAQVISDFYNQENFFNNYLDARKLIVTNSNFGNAKLKLRKTKQRVKQFFDNNNNNQVITGFVARDRWGNTTTLGRGGSDYTASIFGHSLYASSIDIWSDVDGLMTKDPNKSEDAELIDRISFREALKMALNGAKVIYAPTVALAAKSRTPIYLKNTFNPGVNGTVIN